MQINQMTEAEIEHALAAEAAAKHELAIREAADDGAPDHVLDQLWLAQELADEKVADLAAKVAAEKAAR